MRLADLAEFEVSRRHERIGNEKQPTLITGFTIRGQPGGLFSNRLLDNVGYVSLDRIEFKVGAPTAHFTAVLSVGMYQINFRWLARSVVEFGHISIGGHVVRHDLHDGISDPAAIYYAERFAKIEE